MKKYFLNQVLVLVVCVGISFLGYRLYYTQESIKTGLQILHITDEDLYADCHIQGAVCMPLETIADFMKTCDREKSEIVVYCANMLCESSSVAYNILKKNGFENVFLYKGGIADWYQKGFPYQGLAKADFLSKVYTENVNECGDYCMISASKIFEKME